MLFCKELLNCFRIRINNKLEQKVIFRLRQDLHNKLLEYLSTFMIAVKAAIFPSTRVIEDVQNVERAILDEVLNKELWQSPILWSFYYDVLQTRLAAFSDHSPLPILIWMAVKYARIFLKKTGRPYAINLENLILSSLKTFRVIKLIHSFGLMEARKN